jgi:hypothetical protein
VPDLPPLAISADSIPLLTRTIEFARWRSHRVAFLEHEGPFTEGSVPARMRVVSPTAGTKPPLPWRGESRSPFVLDLDPATVRFVRVTALPGTSTAEAPRLAWRASEPAGEWTVANGVWVAGENGPVALFDPWSDPEWWTAPTIRRVSAEDPLVHVALFELLTELKLECSPRAIEYPSEETAEWIFRIPESSLPQPVRGRAVYVLEIFDPTSTGYQRIDCAETTADGVLTLRARVARTPFEGGCNVEGASWSLERRVGGVAIARTTSDDAR